MLFWGVFECGCYPGKLGESLWLVGCWLLKSDPCSILCTPLTPVPLGLAEISQQTLVLIDSLIQPIFIKHVLFLRFHARHWYPRKLRFLEKKTIFSCFFQSSTKYLAHNRSKINGSSILTEPVLYCGRKSLPSVTPFFVIWGF